MKNYNIKIVTTLLCFIIINCKQTNQSVIGIQKNVAQLNSVLDTTHHSKEGAIFLREFYQKYYGKHGKVKGMENYVSYRVLNKIDSLTAGDNLILDYDPFIQGQDWDINVLMKTLEIKALKNVDEYRVSFHLFDKENEGKDHIDLLLKKNEKGNLMIYSILNDEYFNFKTQKNDTVKIESKSSNAIKKEIDIEGFWRKDCGGNLTLLDIQNNEGYLFLYSFNSIYINTILEETAKINEYNLYYKNVDSQKEYYEDRINIKDEDISKTKEIAKIKFLSNNQFQLDWYGLYNVKKQQYILKEDAVFVRENQGNYKVVFNKCE